MEQESETKNDGKDRDGEGAGRSLESLVLGESHCSEGNGSCSPTEVTSASCLMNMTARDNKMTKVVMTAMSIIVEIAVELESDIQLVAGPAAGRGVIGIIADNFSKHSIPFCKLGKV